MGDFCLVAVFYREITFGSFQNGKPLGDRTQIGKMMSPETVDVNEFSAGISQAQAMGARGRFV